MLAMLHQFIAALRFILHPVGRFRSAWQELVFLVAMAVPQLATPLREQMERLGISGPFFSLLTFSVLAIIAVIRLQKRISVLQTPTLEVEGPCLQLIENGNIRRLFYFTVVNPSLADVENVQVVLESIEPSLGNIGWPPIPLHMKHDNDPPYRTAFDMNAGAREDIDLVEMKDRGPHLNITHIASGVRQSIPRGEYTLGIKITGKRIAPTRSRFKVWIENDKLECSQVE